MTRLCTVILLCAGVAFAQGNTGAGTSTGVSRGNGLRVPEYRTPGTGAQSYFVDGSTGSDSFDCRSTASPCLTIQGAINKVPKLLRDLTTVNVAAGNYAGFIVSGFTADNGVQQTTGGLMIDGALANSTIATGSATGTATGGSAGSGTTYGTLVDAAATWTSSDLVGRFLTITGGTGSGQTRVIEANTGTTITIMGTWTAPTGTSTYAIQDPSVILTTAVSRPASPVSAAAANNSTMQLFDNNLQWRAASIVVRKLRSAPASGTSALFGGNAQYQLTQVQLRPTSNTNAIATITSSNFPGQLDLTDVDIAPSTSTTTPAISWGAGRIDLSRTLLRSSTSTTSYAVLVQGVGSPASLGTFFSSEVNGFFGGLDLQSGGTSNLNGFSIVTCGSASGIGVRVGAAGTLSNSTVIASVASYGGIAGLAITTCSIGIQVNGLASFDVSQASGTAGTYGVEMNAGGVIFYQTGGATLTGSTAAWSLDRGQTIGAFSDVTANGCNATASYGSKVCVH